MGTLAQAFNVTRGQMLAHFGETPQCDGCLHLRADGFTCDAFPEEIPGPIFINDFDHKHPFAGDHGVRFERKETDSQRADSGGDFGAIFSDLAGAQLGHDPRQKEETRAAADAEKDSYEPGSEKRHDAAVKAAETRAANRRERDERARGPKESETLHATEMKDGKRVLAGGQPLPTHIKKLAIPPAAIEPRVNLNPKGELMAVWKDAKGRTQMRYSDSHVARAAAAKFGRTSELLKKREKIRKEIETDLRRDRNAEEAAALRLVMHTGMRPGSDTDTKADHQSYGATTLEGRHVVRDHDGQLSLVFVAGKKKGGEVTMPISDPKIAADLVERADKAGAHGRLFDTSAERLRDYSKSKDGGGFKTKDHRTALGTEIALEAVKSTPRPSTLKEYKKAVAAVGDRVAAALGNTRAVAIKSYVDPHVFSQWRTAVGV